jgi:LmbE family N-acetylglucosaminyl deacetylase
MNTRLRVLAVGAHPDDVEFRCGGTLAKYVAAGHHVTMCYATTGDKGHLQIPPAELAKVREQEARAAAAVIGADVIWMGYPDGELYVIPETRMAFLDMIRQANADIILTHCREAYHPDHVAVSELVFAANYLSTVPHLKTAHPAIDHVPPIYHMDVNTGPQLFDLCN